MGKFYDYLKSFDSFGEPISLNYKGDSAYSTGLGAFFSIAIQAFILIFAGFSLVEVSQF